jgi:hypothetical protein
MLYLKGMAWNQQDSMIRRILPQLAGTLLISLLLTVKLGSAIIDVSFLVPMSCLAMLFVAPMVVRAGKIVQPVLIAVSMMAASIALALAWSGAGVPSAEAIGYALAFSLVLTSITAGITFLLLTRMKWRPNLVIWTMRGLMLGLYLAYRTWPEKFPIG